jgi:hypothetical protein
MEAAWHVPEGSASYEGGQSMTEKTAVSREAVLDVHKLDNPSRIEGIIQDFNFKSWQAVVDFVNSFAINVDELANDLHVTNPAAGSTALNGLIWGAALALKIKTFDPCTAAVCIARGLGDFALPGSPACEARFADGYGRLASMLLQRGLYTMAIVGDRIPDSFVEAFSKLAKQAARLRRQKWDVLLLCRGDELREGFCGSDGDIHAEVEFVRDHGWFRVSRSTALHRPSNSPPVVYSVSTVEESVAILDFERANLCIALSGSEAVMFAHPVVGAYVRQARGRGRLARAVAVEIQEVGTSFEDLASRVSAYMVDMYADLDVHGISLDVRKMENMGFPEISGLGAVEALMTFAHRVAAALSHVGKYR